MKTIMLTSGILLATSCCIFSQPEILEVKEVITKFITAADENNVADLEPLLDEHFRIVMNQLFGSTEVTIMHRGTYLKKIKAKEFGGDNRNLKINQVIMNGNTATAKVELVGSKMTFSSILNLVRGKDGIWRLISDTPSVA